MTSAGCLKHKGHKGPRRFHEASHFFTAKTAMIAKDIAKDIALLTHRTIAGAHRGSSTQVH